MPVSVKPRPSWIGLKPSAVIMIRNEKPSVPSGSRVVTRPIAVSVRLPLIVELDDAAVLALVRVEEQVATTADGGGVDGDADARRRLEAERQVGEPDVLAGRCEVDPDAQAEAVDRRQHRPELHVEAGRRLELEDRSFFGALAAAPQRKVEIVDADPGERRGDGQVDVEGRRAVEREPGPARPDDLRVELEVEGVGRHGLLDERVGIVEGDDEAGARGGGVSAGTQREARLGVAGLALDRQAQPPDD